MSMDSTITLALVSAIIGGIVTLVRSRSVRRSKYVTRERQNWRKEIRGIVREISEADKTTIAPIIAKLKVRLNPYGRCNDKDYEHDGHIWVLLDELESSSDAEYAKKKQLLIEYLSLLLKNEWEKAKLETEKNYSGIGWSLIVAAIVIGNFIPAYNLYRGVNCLFLCIVSIICSVVFICILLGISRMQAFRSFIVGTCILVSIVSMGLLLYFALTNCRSLCTLNANFAWCYYLQDKYIKVAVYLFLMLYLMGFVTMRCAWRDKKIETKKYVGAINVIELKLKQKDTIMHS